MDRMGLLVLLRCLLTYRLPYRSYCFLVLPALELNTEPA